MSEEIKLTDLPEDFPRKVVVALGKIPEEGVYGVTQLVHDCGGNCGHDGEALPAVYPFQSDDTDEKVKETVIGAMQSYISKRLPADVVGIVEFQISKVHYLTKGGGNFGETLGIDLSSCEDKPEAEEPKPINRIIQKAPNPSGEMERVELCIPFTNVKPGTRVGAMESMNDDELVFYGFGVYEGEFEVGQEATGDTSDLMQGSGVKTPRLKLDNGETVYGCECWWDAEERIKTLISAHPNLVMRTVAEARAKRGSRKL